MSALPSDVAQLVAALDAVLVPHGFAAAQGSVQHGSGGFTWCCAGEDWVARFPHLPPSRADQLLDGGHLSCVDVVVEVRSAGGAWVLDDARLEGLSLADELSGRPVVDALSLVPASLRALLGSPPTALSAESAVPDPS